MHLRRDTTLDTSRQNPYTIVATTGPKISGPPHKTLEGHTSQASVTNLQETARPPEHIYWKTN